MIMSVGFTIFMVGFAISLLAPSWWIFIVGIILILFGGKIMWDER